MEKTLGLNDRSSQDYGIQNGCSSIPACFDISSETEFDIEKRPRKSQGRSDPVSKGRIYATVCLLVAVGLAGAVVAALQHHAHEQLGGDGRISPVSVALQLYICSPSAAPMACPGHARGLADSVLNCLSESLPVASAQHMSTHVSPHICTCMATGGALASGPPIERPFETRRDHSVACGHAGLPTHMSMHRPCGCTSALSRYHLYHH